MRSFFPIHSQKMVCIIFIDIDNLSPVHVHASFVIFLSSYKATLTLAQHVLGGRPEWQLPSAF